MIKLCTDNPVAYESADYKEPFGCKYNNSTNELFNKKLYELKPSKPLYILDLGCAGGGFIKDCIDDGHIAFGIDGSDYAKINGLGEWKNIPESLDTADITKHFYFTGEITRNNINFDVITMWDVLEHIKPCDIHSVLDNIVYNIKQDGCVICSINVASKAHADSIHGKDWGDGMHHQNVQPPEYWDNLFLQNGFVNISAKVQSFDNEFIRGPGCGCDDLATEERLNTKNLPLEQQWATIIRYYEPIVSGVR